MAKNEWMQFARKKATLSSREFNMIWKAYQIFRRGSPAEKSKKQLKDKPDAQPWHITSATTYGKPLVTKLADKKRFGRREARLSAAQMRVDKTKSVWSVPLKNVNVQWFSKQTADMPIGGDGR